jgi:3-oxoacyl-[acyl-carrier protein] reductase
MLKNKVAVVTGASRGIGAAIAKELARHGAKVLVNYAASEEHAYKVVSEIGAAGGKALPFRADVTLRGEVEAMMRAAERELGPIDILINNAAINFPITPFTDYRWEDFEKKLTNELRASFQTCQAVVPAMVKRHAGCIVNVSSTLSREVAAGFIAHSSAKAALDAFSKSLALELGPHGIRVNVVAPGMTATDATKDLSKLKDAIAAHTPLRRLGEPGDIAAAVLFFCTDQARHVTGTYLPVCGGSLMV